MRDFNLEDSGARKPASPRPSGVWLLAGGWLLVLLIALLLPRRKGDAAALSVSEDTPAPLTAANSPSGGRVRQPLRRLGRDAPAPTAEEIVAAKLSQFSRDQRDIVHAIAKRFKLDVPGDVDRFFDALEANRWEEAQALFKSLTNIKQNGPGADDLQKYWRPILEAFGAAEQVHSWPAQQLLDYGNAVLGSLRPGMVYVGGTDPGCFIPTFLNATSEGERHMVLTQNALADSSYLDYLSFLYGDRLATLTPDESKAAFGEYIADATKRFEHDQQFPDEPKQIRPGENVSVTDNGTQVSGQVAVMSINEKLLQTLLQKNPDLSFALEQSFPFKSTYPGAAPLGPIMELRAQDGQNAFTADSAVQTVDSLQTTAQQLLANPESSASPEVLKSYSHDAVAEANLLAGHNYYDQAEQAYHIASNLCPYNPEAVLGLSELLAQTGRSDEARTLLANFAQTYPDQRAAIQGSAAWMIISSKR